MRKPTITIGAKPNIFGDKPIGLVIGVNETALGTDEIALGRKPVLTARPDEIGV